MSIRAFPPPGKKAPPPGKNELPPPPRKFPRPFELVFDEGTASA
jgi:hypothetical protein